MADTFSIPAKRHTTVKGIKAVANRRAFLIDIVEALEAAGLVKALGLTPHRPAFDAGDYDSITISGSNLSASIYLGRHSGIPLISWYGAAKPLKVVLGAWQDVNQFHRLKATSHSDSLNEVIERLLAGFEAVQNGTAFHA